MCGVSTGSGKLLREQKSEKGFEGQGQGAGQEGRNKRPARMRLRAPWRAMATGVPGRVRKKPALRVQKRSRVRRPYRVSSSWRAPGFTCRLSHGWARGRRMGAAQGDQGLWKLLGPLTRCFPPALGLDSKRVCKTGNLTDKGKGEGAGKYPIPIRILGKHAAKTGREKNGKKERKTKLG